VRLKLEELLLPIPAEAVIDKILLSVRRICMEQRKSLSEDEFVKLAMEVINNERDKIYC
jgi:hypothetical protein